LESLLEDLRKTLKQISDPQISISTQKFFKESIRTYGIKYKYIDKISKVYFKRIEHLEKEEVFKYCR
jgi:DNA-binding transcriptional regulator GbsR (MarR family)